MSIEDEIIKIEEAVRAAQLSHDADFIESILADGFKFVTPQGQIISKEQDVEQYRSGYLKLKTVEINDRTITTQETTAIVRFKVKFEGQAGQYTFLSNMLFTRVYSKGTGGWKMIAGHGSDLKI